MDHLNNLYENLIDPSNFVKNFKDMQEFREWLRPGLINDCIACLKAFEKADMFEHCKEIQIIIDEKVDNMLSGLGFEI